MNKETFLDYIDYPQKLNSDTLNELTELVNDFPFCQTTRLLFTLNLFKEKRFRYDAELKKTAVFVTDRHVLKKHIDALNLQNEVLVLPDEHVEIIQEDAEVAKQEDVKPEEQEALVPEIVDKSPEIKSEHEIGIVGQKDSLETTPGGEIIEETKVEEQVDEKEITVGEEADDKHKKTIDELKLIVKERLAQIEKDKQQNEPSLKIDPHRVEEEVEPDMSANELIDVFIKNEPRISRPLASFFNPVDAARESIVDEENIVSETLAKIYFDQGKFEKSINIYRKLSLKNPEKSSYFAALIEKALEEFKK